MPISEGKYLNAEAQVPPSFPEYFTNTG